MRRATYQVSWYPDRNLPQYMIPGVVYPWVGIVANIVGTIAVMAAVPEFFSERGALREAALIATCGLLFAPLLAAIRDLRSLVRIENVLAAAPVYWLLLDLVQGRYRIELADKRDVITAFAAIGLFSVGVWLATVHRAWRLPAFVRRAGERELTAGSAFSIALVCFALGVFYYLFKAGFDWEVVVASLTRMRWEAAWSRTEAAGGWGAFMEHLSYFGMLLPALAVVVAQLDGWFRAKTFTCWVLAVTYALFQAQGGNRRYVGVMFGAALVVWLINARRVGARQLFGLVAAIAALLFLMEVMLEYRGVGIKAFESTAAGSAVTRIQEIRVDDNFLRLAQSIDLVPAKHPYVWHEYVWFALIRPVPRVLWPGKPLAPSFRVHDYMQIGASLSSSVVGEFYVSGGLLAVIFGGWLYGRLGVWSTRLLAEPRTSSGVLLYGAWLMALFAGCRSMLNLVLMSYVVLALLLVLRVFRGWLIPAGAESHTEEWALEEEVIDR